MGRRNRRRAPPPRSAFLQDFEFNHLLRHMHDLSVTSAAVADPPPVAVASAVAQCGARYARVLVMGADGAAVFFALDSLNQTFWHPDGRAFRPGAGTVVVRAVNDAAAFDESNWKTLADEDALPEGSVACTVMSFLSTGGGLMRLSPKAVEATQRIAECPHGDSVLMEREANVAYA